MAVLALDLGMEFYHPDVLRPESQEAGPRVFILLVKVVKT